MTAVRVVLVGGGASGVLPAARLSDATTARPAHVTIVEPGDRLAAGVAYGTDDPDHLLNVRASGMSADPSRPDQLVEWIQARGRGDADTFVPRRDFREYLLAHLDVAIANAPDGTLEVRQDQAVGIDVEHAGGDPLHVRLASGDVIAADHVVLALGNSAPGIPSSLAALDGHPGWVPNPWAPGALEPHHDASSIVLVGAGLTMVDIAITLGRDAPGSTMTALSRFGLLPRRHVARQPHRPIDVIDLERDSVDVLALEARLRARMADGVGREYPDEDWREVIDAVRPFANALWRRFDRTQQEVFLTQVMRTWDIHRHRMSPTTGARLDALLDDGRLSTHTGQVLAATGSPSGGIRLEVEVDGEIKALDVDAVINCTGPGRSWQEPANPVVADLVEQGRAVPDVHGLGLSTTPDGCLIGVDGAVQPNILVMGPPRRGALFETTAVPELRSQALHLADHIVIGL